MTGRFAAVLALMLAAVGVTAVARQVPMSPVRPVARETGAAAPGGAAVTAPAIQPDAGDAAIAAWFDGYMADALARGGLPGAAIVVVRDGRPILAKGYGYADLAARRPVTVDGTLFRQASVSKLFGWLLVLQLLEQGRIDLDRDVNAYLDFEIPPVDGKPLTMRHLMTHSPGFADRMHGVFDPASLSRPIRDVLAENIPQRVAAPGEMVAYSNYGAALAAHIAERVAGAPFERLVAERIYRPVGMTRSTFAQPVPPPLAPMMATGYAPGSREPIPFERVGTPAAGAMSATAADMARFLTMLMGGGRGANGPVLSAATLDRAMRLDRPLAQGLPDGFGHGFMIGEERGVRHVGHGGSLSGTSTQLTLLPDQRIGWYVAFNGHGLERAGRSVQDNVVRDFVARFVVPAPARVVARGPSSAAEAAGTYLSTRRVHSGSPTAGDPMSLVTVAADADGVLTIDRARRPDGSLRRWLPDGPDRFREEETGAPLRLVRDGDGAVVRFASGFVYPVAMFERAPGWYGPVGPAVAASLLVLLAGLVASPIGWAARRSYGAARPAHGRGSGRSLWAARAGIVLILAAAVGWGWFAGAIETDLTLAFGPGDTIRLVLHLLAVGAVLGAAALAVDAALAWRDPARGWPRRLGRTLTAVAGLVVAFVMLNFGLANFVENF